MRWWGWGRCRATLSARPGAAAWRRSRSSIARTTPPRSAALSALSRASSHRSRSAVRLLLVPDAQAAEGLAGAFFGPVAGLLDGGFEGVVQVATERLRAAETDLK
jgi:hypothetical protein